MTTRQLRIVMVVENSTYPPDVRVRYEAETLAAAGYEVSVIVPRASGQPWHETIRGVRVFRYPQPPMGHGVLSYIVEFGYSTTAAALGVLWRWLRDGLDVIHVHNPPDTLFMTALLPRLGGKMLVYDHHDLAPELYLSKYANPRGTLYRLLVRLERWSCRLANRVIEVNESYRQTDIERNHVAPERAWVVRNGPDLQRVSLRPPDPELRARAATLIAYVGNMASQDGLDHLLGALHKLSYELGYQDWFCAIVGKAEAPEKLRALSDQLGLGERVWFTGFIPDEQMLTILSSADICVTPDPANPLNNKSTMIKVMEYMALGKPVVAYDLAEHRVSAGEAALYARPDDTHDMACQIARLIDDPELRARMGAIGRQRVEQELAWDYSAQRLLKFYDALAHGSTPGED
jgi:glycosyltransferase involved in cell wall biosynthesis